MPLVNLVALAVLLTSPAQSGEWKRTDDGSGKFAELYFAKLEEKPELLDSTKRMPTLFYYWKARWLLNFEVGAWERAHLNISRIVLEILDPESGAALKTILDAHPADKAFAVTKEETQPFRERLSTLAGLEKAQQGVETTPLERWQFDTGIALGDVAGKLIQFHDTHTIPTAQRMFNESLDAVKETLETAPADANPKTLAAMKAIADTSRKTEYNYEDIQALSVKVKAALLTLVP